MLLLKHLRERFLTLCALWPMFLLVWYSGHREKGITRDVCAAGECSLGTSQIACEETFWPSDAGLVLQRAPADEILGKPIFTSLKLWEDFFFF